MPLSGGGVLSGSRGWSLGDRLAAFGTSDLVMEIAWYHAGCAGLWRFIRLSLFACLWIPSPGGLARAALPEQPLAFSDAFAARQLLTGPVGTLSGNNRSAGVETGEPRPGGRRGGHSLWVAFRAEADGSLVLSTAGSSFDTVLAAYRVKTSSSGGAPGFDALEQVSSRDDDDDGALTSTLTFGVRAGSEYAIVVDGYGLATGNVVLSWAFTQRLKLVPSVLSITPSQSVMAGADLQLSAVVSTLSEAEFSWYRGTTKLQSGSQPGMVIRSFSNDDVGKYRLKVKVGDLEFYSDWIELQLNTEGAGGAVATDKLFDAADAPLHAEWTRRGGAAAGVARARGPSLQQTVGVVRGLSGTQVFSTTTATRDPNEPAHCGQAGGASYWFAYEAAETGVMHFDAVGTAFPALLAVYSYTPPLQSYAELVSLACDVAGPGHPVPLVDFPVEANRSYIVVVDGVGGAHGVARLNYQFSSPPPADVAPSLVQSPASASVVEGQPWSLTVSVAGTAPFGFRWLHDGAVVGGAGSATLSSSAAVPGDAGAYVVEVTNRVGAVTSVVARVEVFAPPRGVVVATTNLLVAGASLALEARVSGATAGLVTWFHDSVEVSGASSTRLTIHPAQTMDAGEYRARVQTELGLVDCEAVWVRVMEPVALVVVPQPQLIPVGSDLVLKSVASGTPPLHWQWFKDGAALGAGTGDVLSLRGAGLADAGAYCVEVSNDVSSVRCDAFRVGVVAPPRVVSGPASMRVGLGGSARLTVQAEAGEGGRILWYKDGAPLPGVVGSDANLANCDLSASGQYVAEVVNVAGSVRSGPARLEVVGKSGYRWDRGNREGRLAVVVGRGQWCRIEASAQLEGPWQVLMNTPGDATGLREVVWVAGGEPARFLRYTVSGSQVFP